MSPTRTLAATVLLLLGGCSGQTWSEPDLVPSQQTSFPGPGSTQPVDNLDAPSVEDCGNDIDDDWDGLVDCADPECLGQDTCPGSDQTRTTMQFRGGFWGSYVAANSTIYQDAGVLEGRWFIQHQVGSGSDWTVQCTSILATTGTRTNHTSVDLAFALTHATTWQTDSCGFEDAPPPLPTTFGAVKGDDHAHLFFTEAVTPELWPITTGSISWDLFEGPENYLVITDGELQLGHEP